MYQFVLFNLGAQSYGLPLPTVERVVHAVELTPIPNSPILMLGIINVHGKIMPVLNMRQRFLLPERKISLNDHLIIAHTAQQSVVFLVDTVTGIGTYTERELIAAQSIYPGIEYVESVIKEKDTFILIMSDPDTLLAEDEKKYLREGFKHV